MPILRCREGTVTPIRLLMRSSAVGDQEMASLLDDIGSGRLKRTRHHSRYLKDRGYLREDVSLAEATDILWVCSSRRSPVRSLWGRHLSTARTGLDTPCTKSACCPFILKGQQALCCYCMS